MEIDLKKQLAALREKFRSWRPTLNELGHDYRDLSTEFWGVRKRYPRAFTAFGWALLFFIGVLSGAGLKTLAGNHIEIGHEDYRLLPEERLYALNTLREKALLAGASLPVEPKKVYPACDGQGDASSR